MSKALLILDQVPYARFVVAAIPATWPHASQVVLNHIPRTTPVGHATISTGQEPRAHRVQGRRWYYQSGAQWSPANIDDLPRGTGFPPVIERHLRQHSLAAQLRAAGTSTEDDPIVIVAAKAFLPFLLGAWDSDVSVFPAQVKPDRSTGQLSILVEAFSPRGAAILPGASSSLGLLLRHHVNIWAPGSTLTQSGTATSPRGNRWLEFVWTVPASHRRGPGWIRLLRHHAHGIDAFYSLVGRLLLDRLTHMAAPGSDATLLQSWFSTDWLGHMFTASSPEYRDALDCGLNVAEQLRDEGFRVLLTSDHGGRDTPAHLVYDPPTFEDQHGNAIQGLPPTNPVDPDPFISGDHLVAYGRVGHRHPDLWFWDGGTAQQAALPRAEARSSFHPDQLPDWLWLPRQDEIVDRAPGSGGGSHGACVDPTISRLSEIDKYVPVLALGAPRGWQAPTQLAGIAASFVQL